MAPIPGTGYDLSHADDLAMLNAEVTRQASMIAYVDDFKLMLVLTLLVMPLLLLVRPPRKGNAAPTAHAALD